MIDFPDRPAGNDIPHISGRSLESVGKAHHVGKALFSRHPRQNIRLLGGYGNGLFN